MTDIQSAVHAATAARGYTDGYTPKQFAARQAIKMIEEVEELTRTITLHSPDDQRYISTMQIFLRDAANRARSIFDARTLWQQHLSDDRIAIDTDAAAAEIADIIIVALNLAEALGVDAMAMVQQKAHAGIERGVR